jgi:hypothetical protein
VLLQIVKTPPPEWEVQHKAQSQLLQLQTHELKQYPMLDAKQQREAASKVGITAEGGGVEDQGKVGAGGRRQLQSYTLDHQQCLVTSSSNKQQSPEEQRGAATRKVTALHVFE